MKESKNIEFQPPEDLKKCIEFHGHLIPFFDLFLGYTTFSIQPELVNSYPVKFSTRICQCFGGIESFYLLVILILDKSSE